MPLAVCPDCGSEIPTAAPACPQCGRPVPASRPVSPPPLPSQATVKPIARTIPKTVVAILAAAAVGFVAELFVGEGKPTGNPPIDSLLNGLAGAAFGASAAAYIAALIICGMKGKPVFVIIGVVGLLAIATKPKKESNDIVRELSAQIIIKVWPVIGAIRLAKP